MKSQQLQKVVFLLIQYLLISEVYGQCTGCTNNQFCSKGNVCTACPPNTWKAASQTAVTDDAQHGCTPCDSNKVRLSTAVAGTADDCTTADCANTNCGANNFCGVDGKCAGCPKNSWKPQGDKLPATSASVNGCTPCTDGKVLTGNLGKLEDCTPPPACATTSCTANKYCAFDGNCTQCPPNAYKAAGDKAPVANASAHGCNTCTDGKVILASATTGTSNDCSAPVCATTNCGANKYCGVDGQCADCPKDSWKKAGDKVPVDYASAHGCTACTDGKTLTGTQGKVDDCTKSGTIIAFVGLSFLLTIIV